MISAPKLHFFNPDNDLALAANVANYTPPANPNHLRHDGELLPLWWADENDLVLADNITDYDLISRFCEDNDLKAKVVTSVPDYMRDKCVGLPWGWSKNSRYILSRAGASILPDDNEIQTIRHLSHRRTSIKLCRMLYDRFAINSLTNPVEISSLEQLSKIFAVGHDFVAKLPWSSSGRGVVNLSGFLADTAFNIAARFLKTQGSIIIERPLHRLLDFAMLFRSDKNVGVDYVGLSLFHTDKSGGYNGNLIATENKLFSILTSYIAGEYLMNIQQSLKICLSELISPHYDGYLGVDMMLVDYCGKVAVAPMVELNLRMTMGLVAHHLSKLFAGEDVVRRFIVLPKKSVRGNEKLFHIIPNSITHRFSFILI